MIPVTKYVVFFLGKFPLSWPSDCYPLKPEYDPGQVVNVKDAAFFDDAASAEAKAAEHYVKDNVVVKAVKLNL